MIFMKNRPDIVSTDRKAGDIMSLTVVFRGLILLQVAAFFAQVYALPTEELTEAEAIALLFSAPAIEILGLVYILIWALSLYLIFHFKPLSRALFVFLLPIGALIAFTADESSRLQTTTLYDLTVWLAGLADGAMLAMLFLTDIKTRFPPVSFFDDARTSPEQQDRSD